MHSVYVQSSTHTAVLAISIKYIVLYRVVDISTCSLFTAWCTLHSLTSQPCLAGATILWFLWASTLDHSTWTLSRTSLPCHNIMARAFPFTLSFSFHSQEVDRSLPDSCPYSVVKIFESAIKWNNIQTRNIIRAYNNIMYITSFLIAFFYFSPPNQWLSRRFVIAL